MSLAKHDRSLFATLSLTTLLMLSLQPIASAHVDLNSPNGGEVIPGGSNFSIQWMPAVAAHDTLNFDLWYSTVDAAGPWTAIAVDLPPGDLTVGSLHSHAWAVPNITDASVWVRVRQDNNLDQDYEDVSNGSFSISAAALSGDYNNDGAVNAADYVEWRKGPAPLAVEYTAWRTNFGRTSPGGMGSSTAVPEPTGAVLMWLGSVLIVPLRGRPAVHSLAASA